VLDHSQPFDGAESPVRGDADCHCRARQLNNQVSSFLASYSSYLNNGNVCSVLLLRNDGQEGNRVGFARATFGFQNSSTL
jgi:hypothetical protein